MKNVILAAIFFLMFSCPVQAQELILGTIFELSGPQQATAQEAMNGALLALKKINQSDPAYPLKFKMQSTSSAPEDTIRTVEALKKIPNLSAVTGVISDDAAMTAAPALQASGIPFLCAGAQTDGLAMSVGENIFTLAVPDIRIGQLLAEFTVNTVQSGHIALIRSELNDSCARQADSFARRFKQNGGTVMADLPITEINQDLTFIVSRLKSLIPQTSTNNTVVEEGMAATDFVDSASEIITEKRASPQTGPQVESLVIFAPEHISIRVMEKLRQNKMTYRIIGGSSFDTPAVQAKVLNWPETVYYASQASLTRPAGLVQDFVTDYAALFGSAPKSGYAALGFDAVMILADTARKHGPGSGEIRKNINSVKDFEGVSGKISFKGRTAHKPLYIQQIRSGSSSMAAEME